MLWYVLRENFKGDAFSKLLNEKNGKSESVGWCTTSTGAESLENAKKIDRPMPLVRRK
jgi:hypothetical protein